MESVHLVGRWRYRASIHLILEPFHPPLTALIKHLPGQNERDLMSIVKWNLGFPSYLIADGSTRNYRLGKRSNASR